MIYYPELPSLQSGLCTHGFKNTLLFGIKLWKNRFKLWITFPGLFFRRSCTARSQQTTVFLTRYWQVISIFPQFPRYLLLLLYDLDLMVLIDNLVDEWRVLHEITGR